MHKNLNWTVSNLRSILEYQAPQKNDHGAYFITNMTVTVHQYIALIIHLFVKPAIVSKHG